MRPQDCWPITLWVGIHAFLFTPPFLPFIVRIGIIALAMFACTGVIIWFFERRNNNAEEESLCHCSVCRKK